MRVKILNWENTILVVFAQLFDSEEYVNRTDIFFLKDDHIYFIAPLPESMRQSIYMELSLDKFSKLQ